MRPASFFWKTRSRPSPRSTPNIPREKFVDIIRKTWKKISPRGQALAKTISLPPGIAALVQDATG